MLSDEILEFRTLLEYDKDRRPVGIRFIRTDEDYDSLNVRELKHQLFYCLMIKAANVGHSFKASLKNLYCPFAAEMLGFIEPSRESLSPDRHVERGFYDNLNIAEQVISERPYLSEPISGLLVQPLEDMISDPDVVISISRPYTAMRIMQAYTFKHGISKSSRFSGMSGFCTELTAMAQKNDDIVFSLLCSNARFSAAWRDDEVGVAFPYRLFTDILEGIRKTLDVYETDAHKKEILQRAEVNGLDIELEMGKNYFDSCMGCAEIGQKEYFPKEGVR